MTPIPDLMRLVAVSIILFFCLLSIPFSTSAEFKRVCYYGPVHHLPLDLNALEPALALCTHVIYGFAHVSSNYTLQPKRSNDTERYKKFNEFVKKEAPSVKRMLCVSEGDFANMVRTPGNRKKFINSVLKSLKEWGDFDGLDVDWEFPNKENKTKDDKRNFQDFLWEAHQRFTKDGKLLTVALPGWSTYIDYGFDKDMVKNISQSVDFANLMTYDYNVFSEKFRNFTGPNSPLFNWSSSTNQYSKDDTRYVAWSANHWTAELGLPKEKAVVGISFFGRQFKLKDQNNHTFFAPAVKPKGNPDAKVSYNWTCKFLRTADKVFEDKSKTPYAYKNRDWISYDDEQSVKDKMDWIVQENYGGAMSYTLNHDDVYGNCTNRKKFPLQNVIFTASQNIKHNAKKSQ